MQWDATKNAGFSVGDHTWEPVNPNYLQINAASQTADSDSVYHYTREIIALRRSNPAFIYGDYQDLDPSQERISVYTRTLGESRFLVVLNFSKQALEYRLPQTMQAGNLRLGNYRAAGDGRGCLYPSSAPLRGKGVSAVAEQVCGQVPAAMPGYPDSHLLGQTADLVFLAQRYLGG